MAVAALDLVFLYQVLRESFRGPRVAPVGEVPTAIRGPGGPWHPGRDPFILGALLGPYSRLRVEAIQQICLPTFIIFNKVSNLNNYLIGAMNLREPFCMLPVPFIAPGCKLVGENARV